MGFITDFDNFKQRLRDWSDRGTTLDTVLGDFIAMATDTLSYGDDAAAEPLRVREMLEVVNLTPTTGVCSLPDDYLQYRRVVELSSQRRELEFIIPSAADQSYPIRPAGLSCEFTIVGSDLLMFPVSSNDIELTYYQAIPALSDAVPSNWLLQKNPTLYLNTALMHLYGFVSDQARVAEKASIINAAISTMNGNSQMSEFANAAYRPKGFYP